MSFPAAFVTEYARLLPAAAIPWTCHVSNDLSEYYRKAFTATDEVIRKTPPSGFSLKVGAASRSSHKLAFTFTAQAYLRS